MAETTLQNLVRRVRGTPDLKSVFTNLWAEDDLYRRFFFAHRDLLFTRIEEDDLQLTVPLLFVGTIPSKSEEHVLVTAGDSRAAQLELLSDTDGTTAKEFWQDTKTTAFFLALRFVARNPTLQALLAQGEPSWALVAKTIAKTPPTVDIFDEFKPGDPLAGADEVLHSKLRRYTSLLKDVVRKGDIVKYATAIDLSNNLIPFYGPCRLHLNSLMAARRLEIDEYRQILQSLYLQRLITNVGTTFWCTRCHDDVTMITSRSRIAPEQLNLACPKCAKTMHVATLYEPNPLIHEACFSTDGMLGVAIGWLLSTRGISFRAGTYARDQELDFRFTSGGRRVLLEAKIHKTDKDDEAIHRHLAGDVAQAAGRVPIVV